MASKDTLNMKPGPGGVWEIDPKSSSPQTGPEDWLDSALKNLHDSSKQQREARINEILLERTAQIKTPEDTKTAVEVVKQLLETKRMNPHLFIRDIDKPVQGKIMSRAIDQLGEEGFYTPSEAVNLKLDMPSELRSWEEPK